MQTESSDQTVWITPMITIGSAFGVRVRKAGHVVLIEALGEKPVSRAMPEALREVAVYTEPTADGGVRVDLKINGQTAYTKYIGRLGWLELPKKMVFTWN